MLLLRSSHNLHVPGPMGFQLSSWSPFSDQVRRLRNIICPLVALRVHLQKRETKAWVSGPPPEHVMSIDWSALPVRMTRMTCLIFSPEYLLSNVFGLLSLFIVLFCLGRISFKSFAAKDRHVEFLSRGDQRDRASLGFSCPFLWL